MTKRTAKKQEVKEEGVVMSDGKKSADKVLEECMGKFDEVLVLGVNKGILDLNASYLSYEFLHWILSKAIFKLHVYEDNQIAKKTGGAA